MCFLTSVPAIIVASGTRLMPPSRRTAIFGMPSPGTCNLTCDCPVPLNGTLPSARSDRVAGGVGHPYGLGALCRGPMLLSLDWLCAAPKILSSVILSPSLAHSVCQGRQWHCTGQRCSRWCQALGAHHYVTFDGLSFTFPGACEYLLVREAGGRFSVSAQNLPCGASGLTCTKALTVRLESTVIYMLRGGWLTSQRVGEASQLTVWWGPGCP